MERSMNPSSRRSRRWITKALLELMMEKPYEKISITEIATEADVVRRTFYRNFESKEDVIKTYIESIFKGFIELMKENHEDQNEVVAADFFKYMNRHKVFLKLLEENNMFDLILQVFEERLNEFDEKYQKEPYKSMTETYKKYHNAFHTAGMWYMLETWLKSGMEESPEELGEIFTNVMTNNLKGCSK